MPRILGMAGVAMSIRVQTTVSQQPNLLHDKLPGCKKFFQLGLEMTEVFYFKNFTNEKHLRYVICCDA